MGTYKPIDFEAVRDDRMLVDSTGDEAWHQYVDRLIDLMDTSGLSEIALTSGTLRALIEVLTAGDRMSLDEANQEVSLSLNAFMVLAAAKKGDA